MRLKEEKTLVIIGAIGSVFIVLTSIFIQIIDGKIQNYSNGIITAELKRSQYMQLYNYHSQRVWYWESFSFLDKSNLGVHFKKNPVEVNKEYLSEEIKQIYDKYRNGKMNEQELMEEEADFHKQKTGYYQSRISEVAVAIENMYKKPPILVYINIFLLKRFCLIIQLACVIITAIFYVFLFIEINNRITKNKKDSSIFSG